MWHVCGEEKRFDVETVRKDKLGRHRLSGRIILKLYFKKYGGAVDWINVAQDKEDNIKMYCQEIG
jgi:hypothetical protein